MEQRNIDASSLDCSAQRPIELKWPQIDLYTCANLTSFTIRNLHRRLRLPFEEWHLKRMGPDALFPLARKQELAKKKRYKGQIGLCSRLTKTWAVPRFRSIIIKEKEELQLMHDSSRHCSCCP
jgi:hypothetical protein